MSEVPWFSEPPEAKLARDGVQEGDVIQGFLHFIDPQGKKAVVPVTFGPTTQLRTAENLPASNVWHIDINGDEATVSPSIHYVGFWHSPNPVRFRLVEELSGDRSGDTGS